jgi:hypothetical protein
MEIKEKHTKGEWTQKINLQRYLFITPGAPSASIRSLGLIWLQDSR